MSQLGLFGMAPQKAPPLNLDWLDDWESEFPSSPPPPAALAPRWYQREMMDAAKRELDRVRATLAVAATGLGKTVFFGNFAHEWPGPVLFLAHREELVDQARRSIEMITGEMVEVEQADLRSSSNARLVVGSVQSFNELRCQRLGRERFSLIVVDEAHHYTAPSFRRPIDWFNAKVLGVTATPDRGDKKAMGQIFDSVAYTMGIMEGIEHGYLVPLRADTVAVKELDLSGVKTTAGDLQQGQLDEATLKAIEGIVKGTLEHSEGRSGIVFFAGVKSAEAAALRFNAIVPGSAAFVSGMTEPLERRRIMSDVRAGRYRFLCNCAIATEGFDWPAADLVVLGRPTKSRALCAQMVGRGTRVLPGTIDHLDKRDDSPFRRAAVSASAKPDCLILDFSGNAGKHDLRTPEDVLGGNYSEAEVKLAKKRRASGGNVKDALDAARKELHELAQRTKSQVKTEKKSWDLFTTLNMQAPSVEYGEEPATQKQIWMLIKRFGLSRSETQQLSKRGAMKLINSLMAREQKGLATHTQLRTLKSAGIEAINLSVRRAADIVSYIQDTRRIGKPLDQMVLQGLVSETRKGP